MTRGRAAMLVLAGVLGVGAPARADMPVPDFDEVQRIGSLAVTDGPDADAIVERLRGHLIRREGGRVWILDIAGEGTPWVGVVTRRGRALWLVDEDGNQLELRGPLARPRLAGPGYTIWVTGAYDPNTSRLRIHRLGVLRPSAS